ncbi:MAG: 3-hydroxyacyl-ACP dehydratase FabZ [Desulfurella sp.]|jgi:3-hydroxyacyl-[acyl-carrier-protein] dehydratase
MIDIERIKEILPHRYPFLFVDKVLNYEKFKFIEAVKNVTYNEAYFQGHFPKKHIMPGVVIIEAMAQAGGILAFLSLEEEDNANRVVYFMSIENARFRKAVVPGDTIKMRVEIIKHKMKVWKMSGKCFVDDTLVAEAIMSAKLD